MRRSTIALILLVCAGIATGEAAAAAPTNDNFADAVLLTGTGGTANGTTVNATSETGEPKHYTYGGGGHSVWYRWIAPATGGVTFDTCTSAFTTALAVYTGSAVDGLTAVVADAYGCYPGGRVSFAATAGTTYRIAVDDTYGSSGSFTLAWRPTPAPAPDRAPSVSGTLRVGETLTVTSGGWNSVASMVVTRQWRRCGNGCSDIPGATGTSYTLGSADVGFDLAVAETATNVGGSSTAIAWAGLVEGFAPTVVAVPAFDATPLAGRPAVAFSGSWAGARPLAYAFQWQRCSHDSSLVNAALLAPVRVSSASPASPGTFAVDGDPDSVWAAGPGPRPTIELDLGVPTPVAAVRLLTSQSSVGVTVHRITGRVGFSSDEFLLRELAGTTGDGDTLEAPINGEEMVRFVRIETIQSPAPVAWREIQVLSRCRDIPGAASERYVPRTRDIGSSLRFIVYSTNVDGTTTVATNETAPVEGCIVPRLAGRTVRAAREALSEAGCRLGRVDRASSRVRAGRILRQSAPVGARRLWRAPVDIVVSRGPRR